MWGFVRRLKLEGGRCYSVGLRVLQAYRCGHAFLLFCRHPLAVDVCSRFISFGVEALDLRERFHCPSSPPPVADDGFDCYHSCGLGNALPMHVGWLMLYVSLSSSVRSMRQTRVLLIN